MVYLLSEIDCSATYKSVRKRINSRSSDEKIKCTFHEGASGHEHVVSNRMIQASQ